MGKMAADPKEVQDRIFNAQIYSAHQRLLRFDWSFVVGYLVSGEDMIESTWRWLCDMHEIGGQNQPLSDTHQIPIEWLFYL